MKRALRILAIALGVLALVYAYGGRAERFEIVPLDRSFFVIHDTSSGEYWLMRADVDRSSGQQKLTHSLEDHWEGFSILKRLQP